MEPIEREKFCVVIRGTTFDAFKVNISYNKDSKTLRVNGSVFEDISYTEYINLKIYIDDIKNSRSSIIYDHGLGS